VNTRLAELLAGLSRVADMGFGLPTGSAAASCVLATWMARSLGLSEQDTRAAYYTALLHHVGCVGYAHETTRLFGDDLVANRAAARTDQGSPRDLVATFLPQLTQGMRPGERTRVVARALTRGARWGDEFTTTACEVGRDTARRLGLPEHVQESVFHVYDMWRGHGHPGSWYGDKVPVAARIARLSAIAVLFESTGGVAAARRAVTARAGGMLDPALAARLDQHAESWFADLADHGNRALLLDLEPHPHVIAPSATEVATVFADLADLKSPYFLGHSRKVASLARDAAERLGLPEQTAEELELAGLLHDVGRVAVPNSVWDRAGALGADAWEQVRLHAYHSERVLAASGELSRLAALAGKHHERLDGSGYHRCCRGAELSVAERLLAAADAFQAMTEPRPHRPALTLEAAEGELRNEVRRGRLDENAAHAVLAAAGRGRPAGRRVAPAGLSERELEVLGLVARGLSNADIAARLVISRRTAEHHVQHIYTKIGVSSRAAAALFCVQHGLLDPDG